MSYDNQLARRLAVHNKKRRASRTKRPMCIQPRYYANKGMVWNLIGLYGQVISGYKTPARAKKALRQAQWVYRSMATSLLSGGNGGPYFGSTSSGRFSMCRPNESNLPKFEVHGRCNGQDRSTVHAEVVLVETEHHDGLSCVRE